MHFELVFSPKHFFLPVFVNIQEICHEKVFQIYMFSVLKIQEICLEIAFQIYTFFFI